MRNANEMLVYANEASSYPIRRKVEKLAANKRAGCIWGNWGVLELQFVASLCYSLGHLSIRTLLRTLFYQDHYVCA